MGTTLGASMNRSIPFAVLAVKITGGPVVAQSPAAVDLGIRICADTEDATARLECFDLLDATPSTLRNAGQAATAWWALQD